MQRDTLLGFQIPTIPVYVPSNDDVHTQSRRCLCRRHFVDHRIDIAKGRILWWCAVIQLVNRQNWIIRSTGECVERSELLIQLYLVKVHNCR